MKKIFYVLLVLIFFCVSNVYAMNSYTIKRGESFVIREGRCSSDENMVRFFINEADYQCLMTSIYKTSEPECDENGENCVYLMNMIYMGPLYGGVVPMPGYSVSFDKDVEHEEGKIKLSELVALINDVDNVTRQSVLADLEERLASSKPEGETQFILEAGSANNSIFINVGWKSTPVLLEIDYDEVSNQLSYSNNVVDNYTNIIEAIVLNAFYEWSLEASPNYSNAKNIRDDETKYSYVDEDVLADGVSEMEISSDTEGNYDISFGLKLRDDKNDKIIESYNINVDRANEPEDPTEPVQPNQPIESPNTGTYLSIIGISWLLMFAFVFIYCRKTMFKKI